MWSREVACGVLLFLSRLGIARAASRRERECAEGFRTGEVWYSIIEVRVLMAYPFGR